MQENCDYDSEIENVLLDYEVVGTKWKYGDSHARLPHRR